MSFASKYFFSLIFSKKMEWRYTVSRKTCMVYNGNDTCSICLSFLNSTAQRKMVTRLPCGHLFHPSCIKQWKTNCPLCRQCFFFQYYHLVDRWNGKDYTSNVNGILSRSCYPYNNRQSRSYYNYVLYELRRFHEAHKLMDIHSALSRASRRTMRFRQSIKFEKYFKKQYEAPCVNVN